MNKIQILVRVTDNTLSEIAKTVFSVEIVTGRYGKHSVASAWQLVEKREVTLELFFVDYWNGKSLSIYSCDFEQTALSLLSLNFVDVWLEKL